MAVLRCQEVGVATGLRRDGARNYRTVSSPSQTCPNLGVLFAGWCFSCLYYTFKLSYSHLDLGGGCVSHTAQTGVSATTVGPRAASAAAGMFGVLTC